MGMEILKRIRTEAGLSRHAAGGADFAPRVVQQYEEEGTMCLQIHYLVRLRQATGWTWERLGEMLEEGLSEGRAKRKKERE